MKFVVYLLCSDADLLGHEHYIGITTPTRLSKRMMEHRSQKGGVQTIAWAKQGRGWQLTRTWETDDAAEEHRLQAMPDRAALCPRCEHGLTGAPQTPYVRRKSEEITAMPGFAFPQ